LMMVPTAGIELATY